MQTVAVDTASPYCVHIGPDVLGSCASLVKRQTERAVLVTDRTVGPLYAGRVLDALAPLCRQTPLVFTLPASEEAKSGTWYLSLLSFLAEHRISRSDRLCALGGGVVSDLCGFAAATYLRGIRFVTLPTTLLSDVDASVGGKTAINLPEGKNLAGAFCQPEAVLIDTRFLSTLPDEIYRDGCAEVLKYGLLEGGELLTRLESAPLPDHREDQNLQSDIITECVRIKARIVSRDEHDTGERALLNLGHTLGHGVEQVSGFTIPHGRAVAIGMAAATRAAAHLGLCDPALVGRVERLLTAYRLPVRSPYPASDLLDAMYRDKKVSGDRITLILPKAPGNCIRQSFPVEQLAEVFG